MHSASSWELLSLTSFYSGALDGLLTIVLGLVAELLVVVKATLDTLLSGLVHVLLGLNLTGLLASLGL